MRFGITRKLRIGIIGFSLLILAVAGSASVGAAAPVYGWPAGYACYSEGAVVYNAIPRDATYYPGIGYAYKDNRYCGDGNVIFTGAGYHCANGSPLFATNGVYPYAVGVAPYPGTYVAPYVAVNYQPVVAPVAVPVVYYG